MTVSSLVPVNNYTGNGSTCQFDFDFLIEDEKELVVTLMNKKENTTEQLIFGVDYSINEIGSKNGSFIIYPLEEISSHEVLSPDEVLTLSLNLDIKQESEFENSATLKLDVLEWTFDYIVRVLQILSRKVDRSVKIVEGENTKPEELVKNLFDAEFNSKAYSKAAYQNLEEIKEMNTKINSDMKKLDKELKEVLHKTGDEEVGGIKNFTNEILYKGQNIFDYISNDYETAIKNKQDILTAGDNIVIEDNVIFATGGFNLFDTKLSDHILEGDEAKGWALQGTYVYKEAVAGVRDGYPDFYNKVLEHYGNATEIRQGYLSSNITEGGSIINRQGVISRFSNLEPASYATLPNYFAPGSNTWEFVTKITTGDLSAINMIIGNTTKFKSGIAFYIEGAVLKICLSSNGTSWGIANAKTGSTLLANTEYWFKVEFTGTEYNAYYSTNGVDWIKDITVASTTAIYQGEYNWVLGSGLIGGTDWYVGTHSLDLNESYININGERWWTGTNKYEYKQATNGLKFYDIADKSTIDEAFNLTGLAWFYGVDTENERVLLPRNVWFEQTTDDILQVGDSVNAGLPNITGRLQAATNVTEGAFYLGTKRSNGTGDYDFRDAHLDAGLINSIYGNSDTVQPNAVKKLLYICVGTIKTEIAVTDVVEVTTTENDTMPLFTGMYFDFKPNNPSWLKAGEQANSGDVYTTAYNELVNCLNGTNKYNLKVIDIADMVADVDYSEYWKVNQSEMYFVCPTVAGFLNQLQDNERFLVATKEATEDSPIWYNLYSDGWLEQGGYFYNNESTDNMIDFIIPYKNTDYIVTKTFVNGYYANNAQAQFFAVDGKWTFGISSKTYNAEGLNAFNWFTCGYAQAPNASDYSENINLYFKVANAVQNLEMLNVGEITESLADKIGRQDCPAYIVESYVNGESGYNIYSNGYVEQWGIIPTSTTNITFLKEFLNAQYSIVITYLDSTSTSDIQVRYVAAVRAATGFTTQSSEIKRAWQACGYIA